VQIYVSQLRKVLGDQVIVTRAPCYALEVDVDWIDAGRFERLDPVVGPAARRSARPAGLGPAQLESNAYCCQQQALALSMRRVRALPRTAVAFATEAAEGLERPRLPSEGFAWSA
jgi:hypothetical protein